MNSFVLKILSASIALSLITFIPSAKDTLYEGESLFKEQSIISNNGCFRLTMQNDGNLRIFDGYSVFMWHSNRTRNCN
jgi:hypothetical protein